MIKNRLFKNDFTIQEIANEIAEDEEAKNNG